MTSTSLDIASTHVSYNNNEQEPVSTSAHNTLTTPLTSLGVFINPIPTMQTTVHDNNSASKPQQQSSQLKFGSGPLCILTPCSNSHPFEERRISVTRTEENAVKIGRSVVRLQPSTNNAIFDCKVLSRNHAILWLTNEGQFMIKDTRSSNGTFINSERLSASGEESEPRELFSGDILQLGVEIVDNTKKVASGCVTCIVRLINERGEECVGRSQNDPFSFPIRNEQQIPLNYNLVRNDKLFILDQYIKEAKFRENVLGQKLQYLEEQLTIAQEALKEKWDEHINQELLFSRIELLESQLIYFAAKKTNSSDEEKHLKQEMQQLMEDRAKAEQLAKETLREKFEQVQETSMRLHDAEMGLMNVEEEASFLRQRCADFEDKQNKQREEYEALLVKYNEVCTQLAIVERASTGTNQNEIPINPNKQKAQIILNGDVEEIPVNNSQQILSEEPIKSNENARPSEANNENIIQWVDVPPLSQVTKTGEDVEESPILPPMLPHQCQEYELKQKLAELRIELHQLQEEYEKLFQKYDQIKNVNKFNQEVSAKDDKYRSNSSSTTDFQVFILSVFPFLFIIILFLAPFFHFFGSAKCNKRDNDQSNQIPDIVSSTIDNVLDEAKSE